MRRRAKNRMEGLVGICLLGLGALLALAFFSIYMDSPRLVAQERVAQVVMTSVPPTAAPEMLDLWDGYGRALLAAYGGRPGRFLRCPANGGYGAAQVTRTKKAGSLPLSRNRGSSHRP